MKSYTISSVLFVCIGLFVCLAVSLGLFCKLDFILNGRHTDTPPIGAINRVWNVGLRWWWESFLVSDWAQTHTHTRWAQNKLINRYLNLN